MHSEAMEEYFGPTSAKGGFFRRCECLLSVGPRNCSSRFYRECMSTKFRMRISATWSLGPLLLFGSAGHKRKQKETSANKIQASNTKSRSAFELVSPYSGNM